MLTVYCPTAASAEADAGPRISRIACYAEVEQREVLKHVARQVSATSVRRSLYSKGSVEANLIGTVLWDADLREADFHGAEITGARFAGAVLKMPVLKGRRVFHPTSRNTWTMSADTGLRGCDLACDLS